MNDASAGQPARRRRRRATAAQGAPPAAPHNRNDPAPSAPADDPPAEKPGARGSRRGRRPQRGHDGTPHAERRSGGSRSPQDERAARDITGAGRSQLSPAAALRARDVNRPSADELHAAEQDLVIVRRNWTPDAGRPTDSKRGTSGR